MHSTLSTKQPLDFLIPLADRSLNENIYRGYRSPFWEGTASRSVLQPTSQVAPSKTGLQSPSDMLSTDVYPVLPSSYGSQNKSRAHTARPSSSGNQRPSSSSHTDWTRGIEKPRTRPQSPRQGSHGPSAMPEQPTHRKNSSSGSQIVPHLQIPTTINNSKGSLAEFAAQITCLFWFESSFTLHRIAESSSTPVPLTPLPSEAIPSKMMGFRKWVTTILSTTQVSQNVILLALMFIYRLKKLNPTVKGKPGSEFRLLTVALMLGNKFLDDNTYTNKTWAEVSGISVQEIHVMEVEFLSNMRYSLYTSEADWREWHVKLGRFWNYFDKASRAPPETSYPGTTGPLTPTLNVPPSLPSPPASTHASPPFTATYSPNNSTFLNPLTIPPQLTPAIPSPVVPMPAVDLRPTPRKRSYDEAAEDRAPKRVTRSMAQKYPTPPDYQGPPLDFPAMIRSAGGMPRLPIPNLSISTAPTHSFTAPSYTQLPPPGGRAMSLAFPGPMTWSQPPMVPSCTATSQPNTHNITITPYGQSRQQGRNPTSSPATSSPTSAIFPSQGSSQNHLSPSFFLTNRNSPYRPVRRVSQLLVPNPPLNHTPQGLRFNQMHWQPLGKSKNECKTGVVPYMQVDSWPQMPNSQWAPLPQPNFQI